MSPSSLIPMVSDILSKKEVKYSIQSINTTKTLNVIVKMSTNKMVFSQNTHV